MTAVSRLGPVLLVRNASVLPGGEVGRSRPTVSFECSDGAVHLIVRIAISSELDGETCGMLASAVSNGAVLQGAEPAPVAVHIEFAPGNTYVFDRSRSLTVGGLPLMRLVLPTLDTSAITIENAVRVVSHESYHLFAALFRRPAALIRNEDLAHLVGACSVLMILGELHQQEPGDNEMDATLPGPVARSHEAGVRLHGRLESIFGSDRTLRSGTKAADELHSMCDSIPSMPARQD